MNRRFMPAVLALSTALGTAVVLRANGPQQALFPPNPQWESCEEMHDDYLKRFEAAPGFGRSRMYRPPMLDRSGVLDTGRIQYQLTSVELVGLLRVEPPAVYVPVDHGVTRRAEDFTTRSLTSFEESTLVSFKSGRGIATGTDDSRSGLWCMGAVRAKASCLECHRNNRTGDLLGAFTYRLTAKKPAQQN